MSGCVHVVRIKADVPEEKLRELRPRFIGDVERACPGLIAALLARSGQDTYVDIWLWRTREDAEAARNAGPSIDGFVEWNDHVEIVSFEQLDVVERSEPAAPR